MKLKNKKTGEIREVIVGGYSVSGKTKMWECSEMDANEETGYKSLGTYTSLSELISEWEDYEEPKDYWRISLVGANIDCVEDVKDEIDQYNKEIGNYFLSREEAEKAVEKLNALKRLKDKGFRFEGWTIDDGLRISICTNIDSDGIYDEYRKEVKNDLDVCFGGEE